jgi:hypothetical protein
VLAIVGEPHLQPEILRRVTDDVGYAWQTGEARTTSPRSYAMTLATDKRLMVGTTARRDT